MIPDDFQRGYEPADEQVEGKRPSSK